MESLYTAILENNSEKIKTIAFSGVNINQEKDGKTPLLLALLLKRYEAFNILLELGAKPDTICLEKAIKLGDIKFILFLIKHGQSFDTQTISNIIQPSLFRGQINIVLDLIKELLSRKYDINELWHVVILSSRKRAESEEVVKFLLLRGANPNYIINTNKSSNSKASQCYSPLYTPLSLASLCYPNKKIVQILIEAGANINQRVKLYRQSETSLLSCLIDNCANDPRKQDIIELLITHGATI